MIVYIAGKITGESNYKARFDAAERVLKEKGHIVLNPTSLPVDMDYEDHMKIDLVMVEIADAVYFLKNWKDIPGAQAEHERAKQLKKRIIYESKEDKEFDNVEQPKHYQLGNGLQVIDVIKSALTKEEYQGAMTANVIKYITRWRKKNGVEDLKKAKVYLDWLIESTESD